MWLCDYTCKRCVLVSSFLVNFYKTLQKPLYFPWSISLAPQRMENSYKRHQIWKTMKKVICSVLDVDVHDICASESWEHLLLAPESRKWYPELPRNDTLGSVVRGSKVRNVGAVRVYPGWVAQWLYWLVPFKSLHPDEARLLLSASERPYKQG